MASTTSKISFGFTAALMRLSSSMSCLVDVQAASGIEEDDVVAVVLGVFDGLDRDGDGVDLPHLEHGQAELGADDLEAA